MAKLQYEGRKVTVEILTNAYKIRGTLFVPLAGKGGFNSRLSDSLNNPDKRFLALTEVEVEAFPDANEKWQAPFLAVNKNAVTVVRAIKE
jgi:hypothetical protein